MTLVIKRPAFSFSAHDFELLHLCCKVSGAAFEAGHGNPFPHTYVSKVQKAPAWDGVLISPSHWL